jgi:hypothetical protein
MSNDNPVYFGDLFWQGFGDRLRRCIEKDYGPRGIAEFCRKTGFHRGTLEGYFYDGYVPDLKKLGQILNGLPSCDPSWLIFGEVDPAGLVSERSLTYNAEAALDAAERQMAEALEALRRARREIRGEG